MPIATLRDLCFDCADPRRVARFWAAVLDYTLRLDSPDPEPEESIALDPTEGGLRIWFNQVPEPKIVKNRVHIDINLSAADGLDRLLSLGAHVLQEVRGEDDALWWTVMADPEGNEFCAFPPKP